jgi:hypothetical protein
MKRKITLICSFLAVGISGIYFAQSILCGGEISLAHRENEKYHVVTAEAANLREPFFGTAFHLNYDTDQLEFHNYTLGEFFSSKTPLTLINEKGGKVITGLSLKRGESINNKEGPLVHFYFLKGKKYKPDPAVYFSNTVFSAFEKERKDVNSVKFEPISP